MADHASSDSSAYLPASSRWLTRKASQKTKGSRIALMARLRKEKFDTRRPIDFTASQSDWLDAQADEQKISVMALVRKSVDEYMKQLSSIGDTQTTANSGTKSTHSNGLYTAEQVALLLDAVRKNER
jgi:hypothetical protein